MTIHLITGSDPRLVSDKVSDITRELIKSMATDENRSTILETHDAAVASSQEREDAIRRAVSSAETMSLFGEERVVVIREISDATVAELASLVAYLEHPVDSTHLVVSASGKLAKSVSDALKQAGATVIGGKSEFQGKKYLNQYRRLGSAGIAQAVQLLARADIDLRGGKDLGEELTMEILVARLCRMGGANKSTRTTRAASAARTTSPKRR
ncbi:MAG: hypothetical protein EB108_03020 [Actinobacteria bacterium]|nr:hypothetical protein [Actinomycetota bacterium]